MKFPRGKDRRTDFREKKHANEKEEVALELKSQIRGATRNFLLFVVVSSLFPATWRRGGTTRTPFLAAFRRSLPLLKIYNSYYIRCRLSVVTMNVETRLLLNDCHLNRKFARSMHRNYREFAQSASHRDAARRTARDFDGAAYWHGNFGFFIRRE